MNYTTNLLRQIIEVKNNDEYEYAFIIYNLNTRISYNILIIQEYRTLDNNTRISYLMISYMNSKIQRCFQKLTRAMIIGRCN